MGQTDNGTAPLCCRPMKIKSGCRSCVKKRFLTSVGLCVATKRIPGGCQVVKKKFRNWTGRDGAKDFVQKILRLEDLIFLM